MFLLDLQKSSQHIEMKIKTSYWALKEVSNLKLSPCLTCSVSRMKCLQICGNAFYDKIADMVCVPKKISMVPKEEIQYLTSQS